MFKLDNLSIVITTLGTNDLVNLIECIYKDLDVNSDFEILITIPKDKKISFSPHQYKNLKIISTYFPGQVNQRTLGFKSTSKDYVLQIDDDVEISSENIFNLIQKLNNLDINSAISPVFFNKYNKNKCIYELKNSNLILLLKNILTYIICKSKWGIKRSGTLTILGTNYGVDYNSFNNKKIMEVDWLPGGCILHNKSNLHTYDYYPFKGKAYCEDLIHSSILKKNNIKLYVCKDAICYTDLPLFPNDRSEKIKFLRAYNYYYFKFLKFNYRYFFWSAVNIFRILI